MKKGVLWGGAGLVLAGGLWVWWSGSAMPAGRPRAPRRTFKTAAPAPPSSASPAPSSPTAGASRQPGTVRWAATVRAALSHQWGTAAPPVWATADPTRPGAWLVLAPLAHDGRLWWTFATPRHPVPPWQSVPVSLNMTNTQIQALPTVMTGALTQAYDLMHRLPWALTRNLPPVSANGTLTWQETEARGTVSPPVGWTGVWVPAYGHHRAALDLSVSLPWRRHGFSTPVLGSEGMSWDTRGHLISDGMFWIDTQALSYAQAQAELVPTSVQAGISGPHTVGANTICHRFN